MTKYFVPFCITLCASMIGCSKHNAFEANRPQLGRRSNPAKAVRNLNIAHCPALAGDYCTYESEDVPAGKDGVGGTTGLESCKSGAGLLEEAGASCAGGVLSIVPSANKQGVAVINYTLSEDGQTLTAESLDVRQNFVKKQTYKLHDNSAK